MKLNTYLTSIISDYDMDDPFIDDSEMVQEFEIDLRMKKAHTKQGGFFVSSGKLELVCKSIYG